MLTILAEFLKQKIQPAFLRQRFYEEVYILIKEHTHIELPRNSLSLQKGILFINTHPLHKSEIMFKKEFLFKELKNKYPKLTLNDIR